MMAHGWKKGCSCQGAGGSKKNVRPTSNEGLMAHGSWFRGLDIAPLFGLQESGFGFWVLGYA